MSISERGDQPSRTARMLAAYRARASAAGSPLCQDPWAAALAGELGMTLAERYDAGFPEMELWTALRTGWLDAQVRRFAGPAGPMHQVVLLGAGLDTRAVRLHRAGLRWFEVDHPASAEERAARIAEVPDYPRDAATSVRCDFETEDFMDCLRSAGFDAAQAALFIWEGVTWYLSEAAVRHTLGRVAQANADRSAICFDYGGRNMAEGRRLRETDQTARALLGDMGEPLRFGTNDPLPLLCDAGFRHVRIVNFDALALSATGTYVRERGFRFQSVAMASRATDPWALGWDAAAD